MTDFTIARRDKRQDRMATAVRRQTDPPDAYSPETLASGGVVVNASWEARFTRSSPTDEQVTIRIHAAGSRRSSTGGSSDEAEGRELEDHTFQVTFKVEPGDGTPQVTRVGEAAGGKGRIRYHIYAIPQPRPGGCVTLHFFAAVCFVRHIDAPNIALGASVSLDPVTPGGAVAIPFRYPPSEAGWDVGLGSATWCTVARPSAAASLPAPAPPSTPTQAPAPASASAPAPASASTSASTPASASASAEPAVEEPTPGWSPFAPLPAPTLPPRVTAPPPPLVPQATVPAPVPDLPSPLASTGHVLVADAVGAGNLTVGLRGIATGVTSACILEIRNRSATALHVVVPRGTQFVPVATDHQVMVSTAEVEADLPPQVGAQVEVPLPTLCASPFGYKPPPIDGRVRYRVQPAISPVAALLDTVESLGDEMSAAAAALGMPQDRFEDTVGQYASWATFGSPPGTWVTPDDQSTAPTGEERGIPRFGIAEIVGILNPQLSSRGVSDHELRAVAAAFWDGVDATLRSLGETSPESIELVVEAGLQHVARAGYPVIDKTWRP